MNPFQLVFVPLCGGLALLLLVRGVRFRMAFRQTLCLAAPWAIAAVTIAYPASASVVAGWLGIGRGADLVFYAGVLGCLASFLYFYQRFRRLESLCTELIRREAIRQALRGQERPLDGGLLGLAKGSFAVHENREPATRDTGR
jgi:small membrane protein